LHGSNIGSVARNVPWTQVLTGGQVRIECDKLRCGSWTEWKRRYRRNRGTCGGRIARAFASRFGTQRQTPDFVSTEAIAAEPGDWAKGYALDQQLSGRGLSRKRKHLDPEGEIARLPSVHSETKSPRHARAFVKRCQFKKSWSGRRDSNPRPRPWQGRALPLSYTRIREFGGTEAPATGRAMPNAAR
jgi:hypothetical protein